MKSYRPWGSFPLAAGLFVAATLPAPAAAPTFAVGATGISLKPHTALVAFTLKNVSTRSAAQVEIDSISVGDARLLVPRRSLAVGAIRPQAYSVVHATLERGSLQPAQTYTAVITGRASVAASTQPFTVRAAIQVPPAPGTSRARTVSLQAHAAKPGPAPAPRSFSEAENGPRWVVPTAPTVKGKPTKRQTSVSGPTLGGTVTFNTNVSNGITGSTIAEPSGANSGGVVFMTSNTYAAYSTNNGSSFTKLNPSSIFSGDPVGMCCDQIVQYIPKIDRFVWLMQGSGNNGMRLATASPATIKSSKGQSWTYWDLTASGFSEPSGAGFDYPDLSVGNNYLYMSWDACWPGNPSGCNKGREVVRAPLSGIKAGGYLSWNYTKPSDSANAWGSHLSQDTGDTVFWAGQDDNSDIRVFSWPESSGSYTWTDIGISTWANNTLSSITPDNVDWMTKLNGFPAHHVIGATRTGSSVWFAWSAGTDSNFPQPHIEMVQLDGNNGFNPIQQVQIWSSSYAYGYPALATNACTGEVGLSLEEGGGKLYENHAVGFWGDFETYVTTNSTKGVTRFGDYVTIRQDPSSGLGGRFFDAFGYGVVKTALTTDTRYIVFGRSKC